MPEIQSQKTDKIRLLQHFAPSFRKNMPRGKQILQQKDLNSAKEELDYNNSK